MKKTDFLLCVFATTMLFFSSCKKDATTEPEPDPNGETEQVLSISEETLNAIKIDLGEIGLAIDTRKLAVLGYQPSKVKVQIDGDLSSYSQNDLAVDEYTNLATFKFAVKDLTEEVISGLGNGVNLAVTVFDDNGTELESVIFLNESINENDRSLKVETTKPSLLDPRSFNPSIPYYMVVSSGPNGTDVAQGGPSIIGGYTYDSTNGDDLEFSSRGNLGILGWEENEASIYAQSQKFYFEDQGNNVYRIRSVFEDAYLELDYDNNDKLYWNKEATDFDDRHAFILEKTNDGFVKIKSVSANLYLIQNPYSLEVTTYYNGFFDVPDQSSYHLKFRFLTTGVTWEYTPIDTKYSAPIIPATQMQFGAEVTILNCSDATIEKTFGTNETQTSEFTTSSSETISLYGSNTSGWSATVSATASLSFFGTGVDVTASGTLSGESQSGFETNYTTTHTTSYSEEKEFSQATTVTVDPHSAIELYNATQIVDNVKMPFVNRIKVKGSQNGQTLTGAQIVSQFVASRFPGVITKVDTDNVVVSIRGEITVDKYFKTTSSINDVEGACE